MKKYYTKNQFRREHGRMPTIEEQKEIANSYNWPEIRDFVLRIYKNVDSDTGIYLVNEAGYRTRTGKLWRYGSLMSELRSDNISVVWKKEKNKERKERKERERKERERKERKARQRLGLCDQQIQIWHARWIQARTDGGCDTLIKVSTYWNRRGWKTPHNKLWRKANLSLWRLQWIDKSSCAFEFAASKKTKEALCQKLAQQAIEKLTDREMEQIFDDIGVSVEIGKEMIEEIGTNDEKNV